MTAYPPTNAKRNPHALYRSMRISLGNNSKTNTIPGYHFAITLSFCNGCIWVQKLVLGCKKGSVGATPSFRFAICCFAHACPVSGFRSRWGVSATESHKPERAANRSLCGQDKTLPTRLRNCVGSLDDGVISLRQYRTNPDKRHQSLYFCDIIGTWINR